MERWLSLTVSCLVSFVCLDWVKGLRIVKKSLVFVVYVKHVRLSRGPNGPAWWLSFILKISLGVVTERSPHVLDVREKSRLRFSLKPGLGLGPKDDTLPRITSIIDVKSLGLRSSDGTPFIWVSKYLFLYVTSQ